MLAKYLQMKIVKRCEFLDYNNDVVLESMEEW